LKELAGIAELVATELAEARKRNVTVEVRERLEKMLRSLETMTPVRLRRIRACEVLEGIATPNAVKLLRNSTCTLIQLKVRFTRMNLKWSP
jgi:hypothetical protein